MRCVWDPVVSGRKLLIGGRELAPGAEIELPALPAGLRAQGLRPAVVEASESALDARPEPERVSPATPSDAPAEQPALDLAPPPAESARPEVPEADVLRVARALGFNSAGRGVRERAAAFLAAQPAADVAAALSAAHVG